MNSSSSSNAAGHGRKRSREEKNTQDTDHPTQNKEESTTESAPPPAYGSQAYWEERYQTQFSTNQTNGKCITTTQCQDQENGKFHAWYFTYKELAPILLPLILGDDGVPPVVDDDNDDDTTGEGGGEEPNYDKDRKDMVDDDDDDDENTEGNEDDNCNPNKKQDPKEVNGVVRNDDTEEVTRNDNKKELAQGDDDEEEAGSIVDENDDDVYDDEEEEEDAPTRVGLAKNGPISILEVGCGDVPLGRDLAAGIMQLPVPPVKDTDDATPPPPPSSSHPATANTIIEKVVCIDYSEAVIRAMKEKENQTTQVTASSKTIDDENKSTSNTQIPVMYEVADARELPYPDQHFQLILEKGTLDAMLSDKDLGASHCRSIVTECARVLSIGGAMLIVSHLNAHVPSGMEWFENVLVAGLQKGTGGDNPGVGCTWEVEVHGNDVEPTSGFEDPSNHDNTNLNDEEQEEANPGPAVYIVHKKPPIMRSTTASPSKEVNEGAGSEKPENDDEPTIPLRFFTY